MRLQSAPNQQSLNGLGRTYRRPAKTVTPEQFVDTAIIYKFINENKKDCMLRVEGLTRHIFQY